MVLNRTKSKYNAIALPRGYEKFPFGSLLYSVISLSVHCDGIRSRVEQGAP